jgi:hypothetical protein
MLRMFGAGRGLWAWAILFVVTGVTSAQQSNLPTPIPPPMPDPPKAEAATDYEPIAEDEQEEWGLDPRLRESLYDKAAVYAEYIRRFTCDETARVAEYDNSGEVKNERVKTYGYLLMQGEIDQSIREYRQEFAKDGSLKSGEVKDEESFPPAYAWVFLFSRFNEPYFSFRLVDDRFDGFDWIYEIRFRGSLPFRTGKDIREWEGTVLVDAVTHTPLEIRAEPSGQRERIESLYRQWKQSFNIMGMRTAPRPMGYRAQIDFRRREHNPGLTFPTELRYDTFTAVSVDQTLPVRASVRSYSKYRIFYVTEDQDVGSSPR